VQTECILWHPIYLRGCSDVTGQYKFWALDSGLDCKWTLDSGLDCEWTLDSIMDSIFRLEFQLPGVKGRMHIKV